jgi:hypothetical protein
VDYKYTCQSFEAVSNTYQRQLLSGEETNSLSMYVHIRHFLEQEFLLVLKSKCSPFGLYQTLSEYVTGQVKVLQVGSPQVLDS